MYVEHGRRKQTFSINQQLTPSFPRGSWIIERKTLLAQVITIMFPVKCGKSGITLSIIILNISKTYLQFKTNKIKLQTCETYPTQTLLSQPIFMLISEAILLRFRYSFIVYFVFKNQLLRQEFSLKPNMLVPDKAMVAWHDGILICIYIS